MASLQIATFLLLLSLAKGASAATAATGATCNLNEGCTSASTDTCVPTVLKCLVRAGQTCVVVDNNCVTGATCTGSPLKCACDATKHVSLTSTDYCRLQVDQTCSGTTTEPCLDNGECSTSTTKCVCKTGYVASTDKKTCFVKPGETCVSATPNCVTGATCTGTPLKCACDATKHVAVTPTDYCKLQFDQTCSSTTESCLDNGECSTSTTKCVCKTGYVASTDKKTCSGAMGIAGSIVLLISALLMKVHLV